MAHSLRHWLAIALLLLGSKAVAITFEGSSTDAGRFDDVVLEVPANAQADDLLLVHISVRNGGTFSSVPAGWTQIGTTTQDGNIYQALFYRIATGADAGVDYAWDFPNTRRHVSGLMLFRGVDTSSPVIGPATGTGMSGSVISAPSVTTTRADSMLVALYALEAGNQSFFTPAGMTEVYDLEAGNQGNGTSSMSAYQVQTAIGASGTRDATTTRSNDSAVGTLLALNPVSTNTTPPNPVANWYFDELSWNGTAGEVADSSGNNYHGQAINSSPVSGLLCNAADLSADSNSDYLSMNASAMNGLSDFTVSVWGRTSQATTFATILSGAAGNSGLLANELYMLFDGTTEFRPGISEAFFNGTPAITTANITDDQWHHFAWTRDASARQSCLHMDGALVGCITNPRSDDSDPLSIASGGLIVGQDQDNVGGSFDADQDWQGLLDEMIIFDSVLSATQINNIRTNQLAGNNWDGSARNCPSSTPTPVAEWRLDEFGWSGSAGEVADSSGNNLNGRAVAVSGQLPTTSNAIPTPPDTCHYGEFNGPNQGFVRIDDPGSNSILDISDTLTVTTWIYNRQRPNSGLMTIASKDENWEFHLRSNGRINWWWGGGSRSLDSTSAVPLHQWTHVAIVYQSGQQYIYINGSVAGSRNTTGTLTTQNDPVLIGTDLNINSRTFDGFIDEVQIYNSVLSQPQINTIMNNSRPCAVGGPDHYSVTAPSNNVSCQPFDVTIQAHDSAHGITGAGGNTVTIRTSTNTGNWSGTGVTDLGSGSATVALDSGTAANVVQLHYPVAGSNITLAIDGAGNDDATVDVSLSGFRFGVGTNATFDTNLPNQAAGVDDNRIRLQAIHTGASGECEGLYNNQSRSIGLAASYRNPITGAGVEPTVNGTTINGHNNSVAANSYIYSQATLAFDSESIATLNFNYADVSELELHAQDSATLTDGTTTQLNGSSQRFVVRPHHFDINVSGNPGTTVGGSGFIAAGASFSATVTARANGGAITPNYGNEITPESVILDIDSLVMPVGGSNTGFNSSSFTRTANGTFTGNNLSWDNVGTIRLLADVADGNYLGAGPASNPQPSGNVGRFFPASFALTSATTNNSCGSFTYMGQPNISVNYNLVARNTSGGTTSNYAADSDSNPGTTNYPVATIGHRALQGATDLSGRLAVDSSSTAWVNGVYTLSTSSAAINRQPSTAPDGPFNSVQLSLTENDPDADVSGSNNIGLPLNLRFGRAVISSVHGPESTLLSVPFGTEYWNSGSSSFIPNTADNCSAIAVDQIQFNGASVSASPQGVDFIGGPGDDSTGTFFYSAPNATASSGIFGLMFSPPGAGNTGSFPVNINLTNYPWLRSDWNQDGNFGDLNLPEATISFGSYRGHDRVIYWRERFD